MKLTHIINERDVSIKTKATPALYCLMHYIIVIGYNVQCVMWGGEGKVGISSDGIVIGGIWGVV